MSSPLPIEQVLPDLLAQVTHSPQVILKAPPGAGKSTHFPLALLSQATPNKRIILLEPRRLAARNIARYLAQCLGESVGQQVGLRMRGETRISAQTRLEVVTEGVLTRMIQADPELDGIGYILFDEFHERSLHADTALALALEVQGALRDDLHLVIMSATLDGNALQSLLPEARYVESEGRCYPVEYRYQAPSDRHQWLEAIEKTIHQLLATETGSMLVFLPGVGEISRLAERLTAAVENHVDVCPLYGQLNSQQQQAAIAPSMDGRRKVVLATNIAETSLTIDGVRLVVDSGLERTVVWDPNAGLGRLDTVRISQSSAEQRAGRAGRLSPGICVRLYSQSDLHAQPALPVPEILRSDLTPLAMELSRWGCSDAAELCWLDLPPKGSLQQGYDWLEASGLCSANRQLSALGQEVAASGAEPRQGLLTVFARRWGEQACKAAALVLALLEQPLKGESNPDLAWLALRLFDNRQRYRAQWQRAQQWAANFNVSLDSSPSSQWLGLLLAASHPDRIGLNRGQGGRFQLANGQGVEVDDAQTLADSPMIVAVDLMRTRQSHARVFSAIEIALADIEQYLPHLLQTVDVCEWDEQRGRFIAERQVRCGKLALQRKPHGEVAPEQITAALVGMVQSKGLHLLEWSDKAESLLQRARYARSLGEALPELDDAALRHEAQQWLAPFLHGVTSLKALRKVDLYSALEAWLGWDITQTLNRRFPTHYQVPTGSNIRLKYFDDKPPVLSVRMQEMYGESQTPTIADGTVALVMELLSPAQRPLQVTQDLAAFWGGSYKEVQKEMKGRYPKHVWPDDPANHIATTKTKRHFQDKS
uniref:ATP-dependent helicase HrpB n=1 Tax=Thaumasiovibrio occultus TaxID=1891184 RepID=UPI000B352D67|nr:ATP-dependent helicase HrpB [Thaumasiovibrio occultus]